MANGFSYSTAHTPSESLAALWNRELKLFEYREPNPHGRSDLERRGWGFPAHLAPPPDCYEFIVAHFKREALSQKLTDPLTPEYRFAILTGLMALFAWLRTGAGTRWLLHLYGIQIVPPHPGYAYYYEGARLSEPEFGLRLYQVDRSTRHMKSPTDYYGLELVEALKTMLQER